MPTPAHLDTEDAALYALGTMDDVSRRSADRHVPDCPTCSRLVGEAERDVAVLAAAEPAYRLPPDLLRFSPARPPARIRATAAWALAAAAFLIAMLPATYFWEQNRQMRAAEQRSADAVARLSAPASFRTADFRGLAGGASARVMYAPDGSWYVVLVRGASHALQVAWLHGKDRTMLGATELRGEVAMLYLPKSHRMGQLALMDGGQVVAEAQLAY